MCSRSWLTRFAFGFTDANTVPAGGYPAGIDGVNALGFARPVKGDFRQLSNDVAVAGQLSYGPPALPGFKGSVSAYYTPNTTPRGAYADSGLPLGRSSLAMFDAEFRYRLPVPSASLVGAAAGTNSAGDSLDYRPLP